MKPRWIIAAAAVIALGLLSLPMLPGLRHGQGERISSSAPDSHAGPRPTVCDADGHANLDFTLKNQFNVPVHLADYKGKVVLMNFWATWCGPCQQEIPSFVELYDKYKSKGFVIVGVSIDDTAAQLQSFMKQYRMNYPVVQMKPEVEDAWGPFYGYPTSFFVSRDGSICTKHLGPVTKEDSEQEIQTLLGVLP
jgi:cytochrome c biogenesis protein CcmG/thiol:disulfide interchange protein DsbE